MELSDTTVISYYLHVPKRPKTVCPTAEIACAFATNFTPVWITNNDLLAMILRTDVRS